MTATTENSPAGHGFVTVASMPASRRFVVLAAAYIATAGAVGQASHADSGQLLGIAAGLTAGASLAPGGALVEGRYLYEMSDETTFEGRARFTYGGQGKVCDEANCTQSPFSGHATQLDFGVRIALSPPAHVVPWVRPSIGMRSLRYVDADITGFAVPIGAMIGATMGYKDNLRFTAELGFDVAYSWLSAPAQNGSSFSTSATIGVEFLLN